MYDYDNIMRPAFQGNNNVVFLSTNILTQYVLIYFGFYISLILMVLVFTVKMMLFKKQEKKAIEDNESILAKETIT